LDKTINKLNFLLRQNDSPQKTKTMNKHARIIVSLCLAFLSCHPVWAQKGAKPLPQLLLRVDDIGMNHATNMALEQLAQTGMPFSASVMFACPWYQETIDIV
jgi:hypothetical protein